MNSRTLIDSIFHLRQVPDDKAVERWMERMEPQTIRNILRHEGSTNQYPFSMAMAFNSLRVEDRERMRNFMERRKGTRWMRYGEIVPESIFHLKPGPRLYKIRDDSPYKGQRYDPYMRIVSQYLAVIGNQVFGYNAWGDGSTTEIALVEDPYYQDPAYLKTHYQLIDPSEALPGIQARYERRLHSVRESIFHLKKEPQRFTPGMRVHVEGLPRIGTVVVETDRGGVWFSDLKRYSARGEHAYAVEFTRGGGAVWWSEHSLRSVSEGRGAAKLT